MLFPHDCGTAIDLDWRKVEQCGFQGEGGQGIGVDRARCCVLEFRFWTVRETTDRGGYEKAPDSALWHAIACCIQLPDSSQKSRIPQHLLRDPHEGRSAAGPRRVHSRHILHKDRLWPKL